MPGSSGRVSQFLQWCGILLTPKVLSTESRIYWQRCSSICASQGIFPGSHHNWYTSCRFWLSVLLLSLHGWVLPWMALPPSFMQMMAPACCGRWHGHVPSTLWLWHGWTSCVAGSHGGAKAYPPLTFSEVDVSIKPHFCLPYWDIFLFCQPFGCGSLCCTILTLQAE